MFLIDKFLGGTFWTYGLDVMRISQMDPDLRDDPMIKIFPRVTKCTFHKYGASGTIQKLDALCVLALNILNEKIYIFLWFWFLLLAVISIAAVLYTFTLWILPTSREAVLKKRFKFSTKTGAKTLVQETEVK